MTLHCYIISIDKPTSIICFTQFPLKKTKSHMPKISLAHPNYFMTIPNLSLSTHQIYKNYYSLSHCSPPMNFTPRKGLTSSKLKDFDHSTLFFLSAPLPLHWYSPNTVVLQNKIQKKKKNFSYIVLIFLLFGWWENWRENSYFCL